MTNAYALAALDAPAAAPYPLQRGLTRGMREVAAKEGKADRMQMWAGQGAKLARTAPAGEVARELWERAIDLLSVKK